MSKEDKEWCIALDDVGWYDNSLFGKLPIFLKGERATKEKVFFEIPDITEEDYNKYFRPATEEEINGEFEWNGEQFVLKRSKRMKSINEKAEEWADMYPSCGVADKSFTEGANYVLDILEQALTPQRCLTDMGMDICPEALVKTALQTIEELKQ